MYNGKRKRGDLSRWLILTRVKLGRSGFALTLSMLGVSVILMSEFSLLGLSASEASRQHNEDQRAVQTGTVKWFNQKRSYGFIQPSEGEADVYFEADTEFTEGACVEYQLSRNSDGKKIARQVRLCE